MIYRFEKRFLDVRRADDDDVGRRFDALGFLANIVTFQIDIVTCLVTTMTLIFLYYFCDSIRHVLRDIWRLKGGTGSGFLPP